jgi:2-oxoglutarate dehydrogenase E1 component
MRLASEYRQTFQSDVVIDLVCFRRYGHNEGDEPAFTQPSMYHLIRSHKTTRQLYAEQLAEEGRISAEESEAIRARCMEEFHKAHARAKQESQFREPSALEGLWKSYRGGRDAEVPDVDTGVAKPELQAMLRKLCELPEGFKLHPTLANRFFASRKEMAEGKQPLDWSAGEALALGTLLVEGHHVRLTGQDSERGTFSHRQAVLHDVETGTAFTPLENLAPNQAKLSLINSPLSEMGCLGFEFGYSLDYPEALVAWEAQFGDFANNAQVVIDQFIVAAERKWRRLSGLTLLLPHGYEGAGPEHSSARLERFLELAAEDNIQVCYPTTPAQIFHLLRRQVVRGFRKPLIVMTPKSLLRRPEAVSSLDELASGRFQRLLPDTVKPAGVKRLLLCSGKVYYDLVAEREKQQDPSIAILRVEQLYPFPRAEIEAQMKAMSSLEEIYWVQEEPKNMGSWRFVFPILTEMVSAAKGPLKHGFIGRVESASPATGFQKAHDLEQRLIVEEAITRGAKNGR